MALITVFTPSYNRAHLLYVAYQSLCLQTCKDFEWLIVDDGSTDNTEEVVDGFVQEGKITVRYCKKTNGGKHTAINMGAKEAKGELFWILDSDDSLLENAISKVIDVWKSLDFDSDVRKSRSMSKSKIAGICGYMAHHDGTVIGSPIVENGTIVSSIDMRHKLHITGDMMEVWRTDIIREFPFPEIKGERFCPEILVWNRIAKKYPLYMIPDVIYYRDYLDGGLTDNIMRIRHFSPLASMMTYAEMFHAPIPRKDRIKAAINYWRFSPCSYYGKARELRMLNVVSLATVPLGIAMRIIDKMHL